MEKRNESKAFRSHSMFIRFTMICLCIHLYLKLFTIQSIPVHSSPRFISTPPLKFIIPLGTSTLKTHVYSNNTNQEKMLNCIMKS